MIANPIHIIRRRVVAAHTINNSATFENTVDLHFPIGVGEVWVAQAVLVVTSVSGTADFKVQLSLPTGGAYSSGSECTDLATQSWITRSIGNSPPTLDTGEIAFACKSGDQGYLLKWLIVNGANAGTCMVQWAQYSATAENTILKANSVLIAHPMQ